MNLAEFGSRVSVVLFEVFCKWTVFFGSVLGWFCSLAGWLLLLGLLGLLLCSGFVCSLGWFASPLALGH